MDDRNATPSIAKADPEALALRAQPRPIVRFKRSAIIGISAASAASLMAITFVALKPATFLTVAGSEDKDPAPRGTPDALAAVPGSYDDVPKLGPPLPGDLGRPILEHQRSIAAIPGGPGDASAQALEAAIQRREAEEIAARQAGVMVARTGSAASDAATSQAPGARSDALAPGQAPSADSGAGPQRRVVATVGGATEDVNPHALTPAQSPWMLHAGSIIAASLITGLQSDLPGLVTAQVTEGVYDSVTGRTLLIPQRARLVGRYDSVVAFGQTRALVIWQRIILPDGSSIRIDNIPASDASGYAGLSDRVDVHTWALLKGVVFSTLLGVGTELSFGNDEGDLIEALRESAQANADRAGQ